jgi:DNA polymerase-1
VVPTGRLASDSPNLQNIPIRTSIGDAVRACFIPEPGNVIVGADYKGVEVRGIAHLSKDPTLCQLIRDRNDPHLRTAAYIFSLAEDKVPTKLRDLSKTCFFLIVYLGSPPTLANQIRPVLTVAEARELCERRGRRPRGDPHRFLAKLVIEGVYATYPRIGVWQQQVIEDARRDGYTRSLMGRRRKLSYLNHWSEKARAAEERIMKAGMAGMWDALGSYDWYMPILQIHDELQTECPKERAEEVAWAKREILPNALTLDVPLEVDVKIGQTWAETH